MATHKNIRWLPLLMAFTILAITSFQGYWLVKTYQREERTLEMRTNMLFRETLRSIQASKLKLDSLNSGARTNAVVFHSELDRPQKNEISRREKMIGLMDVIVQRTRDTTNANAGKGGDSKLLNPMSPRQSRIIQFLYDMDSLQDTIKVSEVEAAYAKKLAEQNLDVAFKVSRVATRETEKPVFNEVTLGFAHPITFRLDLENTFPLLLKRISAAIIFSIFLVGFTIVSFLLLFKNLQKQRKLGDIKNEFISNITHELKTPISTVSVAIEALRNFNQSLDPQKTKEYLEISANELQRLSLLVDKVLKLSMFENKEIELKNETVDLYQLVNEVSSSLRLQFENRKADVKVSASGNTTVQGDRLHLVSVVYNLMDNALKYSNGHVSIDVDIREKDNAVQLKVADKGIGIPQEYQNKIFEKFFRVPHGNLHNAKGYGLGLSYVHKVVEQHKGSISVHSGDQEGSTFVIHLPKQAAVIA